MKRRYLVGGILILICAVTTAFTLARTAVRHVTFAQAKASGRTCQVYGALDKQSVRMAPSLRDVRFRLIDEQTGEVLNVHYRHPSKAVNSNMPQASHARVLGVYNPITDTFEAEEIYTKCPSKYESGGYTAEAAQPAAESGAAAPGR